MRIVLCEVMCFLFQEEEVVSKVAELVALPKEERKVRSRFALSMHNHFPK